MINCNSLSTVNDGWLNNLDGDYVVFFKKQPKIVTLI